MYTEKKDSLKLDLVKIDRTSYLAIITNFNNNNKTFGNHYKHFMIVTNILYVQF